MNHIVPPLLLIGTALAALADPSVSGSDSTTLGELNREYVRSARESDVAWFDQNLAPDFFCTNPDGSIVAREQFLKQTAQRVPAAKVELEDVNVRVMGDFALIHARVVATLSNGQIVSRRYTDAWARRDGRWLAVSAHITPVQSK